MNIKEKWIISAFILLITSLSCSYKKPMTCLTEYDDKINYSGSFDLTIDSLSESKLGCQYFVSTAIELRESFIGKALMYQQSDKIYLRGIDPVQTEDFVLFDFNLRPQQVQEVKIFHNGLHSTFNYSLEKKITINDGPEVYIFRTLELRSYEGMSLDVMFFITKEHGVIGSFTTTEERTEEGEEIMISPRGNILKDYIDYSNFALRELL